MSKRVSLTAVLVALLTLSALGCARVVPGTDRIEVVSGSPSMERGDVLRELVVSAQAEDAVDSGEAPSATAIATPLLFVSAVAREPVTVTIPRVRRSSREIIPYNGLMELWETPWSLAFGWAVLLNGQADFGSYLAGVNPFMNSDVNMISGFPSRRRETETVGETEMTPRLERRDHTRRIEGTRVALGFPGSPRIELVSEADGALRVPIERLVTAPLSSAPRAVEGVARFDGVDDPARVRVRLTTDLSDRLLRLSRTLEAMDESSAPDVARALLEIEKLGFPTRAEAVERAGTTRHGSAAFGRAIADLHMIDARAAAGRGDRDAAREAIQLARARVSEGPKEWDLLEADLHEAEGLTAIEERRYERARDELLRASRLDSDRQARLSGFVAIAIEAMDRETVREERVGGAIPQPGSAPMTTTAVPAPSNVVEQCLAREAALQACRALPGFGKDICKSGVRAKYASVSCP